ncbi:MAG: hypothetical protein AB7O26_00970 [Planctomycetaceae bacterium]
MSTNELNNPNDLDWTAFRYVSGELAGDELAAFETLLAENQAARDAVVDAVKVAGAVVMAESAVKPALPRILPFGGSRAAALAWVRVETYLALAAVVGIAIVFWMQRPSEQDLAKVDPSRQGSAESVFDSRSSVLALWTEWSSTEEPGSDESSEAVRGESDSDVVSTDVDSDFEVPGWMIAALSPSNGTGPDDSDDLQMEN